MNSLSKALFVVTIAGSAFLGLTPIGREGAAQADEQALSPTEQVKRFDAIMDRHYRGSPLEKEQAAINQQVAEFNQRALAIRGRLDTETKKLKDEFEGLKRLQAEIEKMESSLATKPGEADRAAVEAYNARVDQRNLLVRQYNDRAGAFEKQQQDHRHALNRSRDEAAKQEEQLNRQTAAFKQRIAEYRQWVDDGKDVAFFKELNRFYARLKTARPPRPDQESARMMAKIRAMRQELGERAVRDHRKATNGLVVVAADLGGGEKCILVVDTGATAVTISPPLVEALGLTDRLGKRVDAILAGGIKTSGRELVIPKISVLGMEATNVDAVMLDEPEVGIDGLLGMSFLKQFDFQVDPKGPDGLILKTRGQ